MTDFLLRSVSMPSRLIVANELAEIMKVIAHADRIRLIEELSKSPLDVSSLSAELELPAARVSQHLALLKAHRMVIDERDGRRHVYRLTQPQLASWIVGGIEFIEARGTAPERSTLEEAKRLWSQPTS